MTKLSRPGSSCSIPGHLQIPLERYSLRRLSAAVKLTKDVLSEEQAEAIRNCGVISTVVLGLMKSFSTTDVTSLDTIQDRDLRRSISEPTLYAGLPFNVRPDLPNIRQLDIRSRSCSTWVAVGDMISCTSQLASPHVGSESVIGSNSPAITPIDFVLSVNRRIRQMYIRRRLLSTYRALERFSRSQLNLNEDTSQRHLPSKGGKNQVQVSLSDFNIGDTLSLVKSTSSTKLFEAWEKLKQDVSTLTVRDIELQKGKPLSKYDRNMMIFNWLQDVDEDQSELQPE
ncbi:hypothetical protein HDE_10150 [Halotydeus destructor]|nr:hypothetical protein HDE_10150 [Halotydeus destructor]